MDPSHPTPRDSSACAIARLEEFLRMTDAERRLIQSIMDPVQHYPRHAVLRREGSEPTHVYLLVEGWVAASLSLACGRQQIVKLHLPTDLLGVPSLCLTTTADSLVALTPIAVRSISRSRMMAVFQQSPRIAASLFLSAQKERIALMDALAVMGQADAAVRLAAMLSSLNDRLEALGETEDDSFRLPLTQREIGDVVGITTVHANRTLRQLETMGLISRSDQRIRLIDRDKLRRLAGLPRREFLTQPTWVPDYGSGPEI